MRKKYSIGIVVICVVILGIVYLSYDRNNNYMEDNMKSDVYDTVTTQGNITNEESFYLAELNGFVVVYLENKTAIYEYTNILISDLPEDIQREIQNWKKIEGKQELYGFLENYSS